MLTGPDTSLHLEIVSHSLWEAWGECSHQLPLLRRHRAHSNRGMAATPEAPAPCPLAGWPVIEPFYTQ